MIQPDAYIDLKGREISLTTLDTEERGLVRLLQKRSQKKPAWIDFRNFWTTEVAAFYDSRGLSRRQASGTAVFQIAQDLSSRLAIASGMARESDYRDELEDLIRTRFRSRRAFCKAAGISEDMLSHVLAGRKDLSIQALTEALSRIGYRLRIAPLPQKKRTG